MTGKAAITVSGTKGSGAHSGTAARLGLDITPEEEAEILEDCNRRLDELARVLFAVWQRQQPQQKYIN